MASGTKDMMTPVLMDMGSITRARIEVTSRKIQLAVEDEASIKSSAPFRSVACSRMDAKSGTTHTFSQFTGVLFLLAIF